VGRGTGLGLATVYGIVKQHQGWVEVSSHLGDGTTFKFFLPANDALGKKELASKTKLSTSQGGHEKILLVEDDADVRMFLRHALENSGYQIREAGNGMEALNIWSANTEQFDLLLTDIIMPGVTGTRLAEQLKEDRPNLKVIFMSGYNPDIAGKIETTGHFLQKPCSLEALTETVRRCLDEDQ
jgi:CheY-like chemotaxis protein